MQFNSTEAQEIAASGVLKGLPLTPSPTATSSSSPSSTSSAASPNDRTEIGPIVGGVVGGVLGLLLIGILIWWIMWHRRSSLDPNRPAGPSTDSKGPTPALIRMIVPVPLRPPRPSYPSSIPSQTPTSNGTGNAVENSSSGLVQHAPGALGHSGAFISYPYGTTGIGPTFNPPSMVSSGSVGQPSTAPQRVGSSRSMIARFVFPRKRTKRNSDVPSTLSQGSSRMSQMGILHSPTTNMGHLPPLTDSSPVLGPIPGPSMLEPTPYILPPISQDSVPSSGGNTSYPREKVRINPPGYTSPEAIIPSTLSQPIPAVQAHTTQPFSTHINRMIVTTPDPMGSPMPEPPSYVMSQAETQEEQLRRAASNATAGTRASSSNLLPTPSTPERRGGPLEPVPESAAAPHGEADYPPEKV